MEKKNKSDIKPKLLLVGDTTWPMYVKALYDAAQPNEYVDVELFDLGKLNSGTARKRLLLRLEYHYAIGIEVLKLNKKLFQYIIKNKISYVFLYSVRMINWRTIKALKNKGVTVAIYCNDNPFSNYYPAYFWKNLRESSKFADITYSYRECDMEKYKRIGAQNVKLLRSYYIAERNYLMRNLEWKGQDIPPVIFLGHHENDEREEYLDALIEKGIRVGLQETKEWESYVQGKEGVILLKDCIEHYNEIINMAKIAIVFLSKINKDTYTRRCFEIPITGTMMLAPYTQDLANLFEEGTEIVFYRNKKDFVDKTIYYLENQQERVRIGMKGRERVLKDGHETKDRLNQIIEDMGVDR